MSIESSFPRAAEGRELLVNIRNDSKGNVRMQTALRKFEGDIKFFNQRVMNIGGDILYDFENHKIVEDRYLPQEEKQEPIAAIRDFFPAKITELATALTEVKDQAEAIEQYFRKIIYKASIKEKGSGNLTELRNISVSEAFKQKIEEEFIRGTPISRDTPEYKEEKAEKEHLKKIQVLKQQIQKLENDLKGQKSLPTIIQEVRSTKILEKEKTFIEVIDTLLEKLIKISQQSGSATAKAARNGAIKSLNELKDAINTNKKLDTIHLNPLNSNFFPDEIFQEYNFIIDYHRGLIEQTQRGDVLQRQINEKKEALKLLQNPPTEGENKLEEIEELFQEEEPTPSLPNTADSAPSEVVTQKEEPMPTVASGVKPEQIPEKPPSTPSKAQESSPAISQSPKKKIKPSTADIPKSTSEEAPSTKKTVSAASVTPKSVEKKPETPSKGDVELETPSPIEQTDVVPPATSKSVEKKPETPTRKVEGPKPPVVLPLYRRFLNAVATPFIWLGNLFKRAFHAIFG